MVTKQAIDMHSLEAQRLNRILLNFLINYRIYLDQPPLSPEYKPLDGYIAEAIRAILEETK